MSRARAGQGLTGPGARLFAAARGLDRVCSPAMLRCPRSLLLLTLLFACGPAKETTTDDTTTTSGPGASGTTNSPTTGPVSCDMYKAPADDETGPSVEFTIKHQGTQPIFVNPSGCGGAPLVEILDASGTVLRSLAGECSPMRCDEFLGSDDCSLACNDCAVPSLTRIEPGASVKLGWQGVYGAPTVLPTECAPGADCQRECLLVTQAAPGAYSLQLQAFRTCTGECECDVPGADSCSLWSVEGADPVTFSVELMYPEVTAIEIPLTD